MSQRKVVFLPHVSEFGWFVMWHMRRFHTLAADVKIACCRRGEEVFFPSASGFFYDWISPVEEESRWGAGNKYENMPEIVSLKRKLHDLFPVYEIIGDEEFDRYREEHIPLSWFDIRFSLRPKRRGLRVDVALAPRNRHLVRPWRNWPKENWQVITHALTAADYTFGVCGKPGSTHHLSGSAFSSWDVEDCDGTVELLQNCKLYVGLDSGVSHLAAFLGTPMFVVSEQVGAFPSYLRAAAGERYDQLTQTDPGSVAERVLSFFKSLGKHPVCSCSERLSASGRPL